MWTQRWLVAAVAGISLAGSTAAQPVLYVDASAPGGGDGRSWATAFADLGAALASASAAGGAVREIWVARGVYVPRDAAQGREASFWLVDGVAVYGGFRGNESRRDDRDVRANVTMLSGDVVGDDGPARTNRGDNVYHVVRAGPGVRATLDGFVVRGGWADETTAVRGGAGLHIEGGQVTVRNSVFRDNHARHAGGAVRNQAGQLELDQCFLEGNSSGNWGGAVYAESGWTAVQDCSFAGNWIESVTGSGGGGALCTSLGSTTVVRTSEFADNTVAAAGRGGAVYNFSSVIQFDGCRFGRNEGGAFGGAVADEQGSPQLARCVFEANRALEGGAVSIGVLAGGSVGVVNCEFRGNEAAVRGGAARIARQAGVVGALVVGNVSAGSAGGLDLATGRVINATIAGNLALGSHGGVYASGSVRVINSIVWANGDIGGTGFSAQLGGSVTELTASCVQDWTPALGGSGNIGDDPMFMDGLGPDGAPGTSDDDWRLMAGSPCVDAGLNAALPRDALDVDGDGDRQEVLPLDVYGQARVAHAVSPASGEAVVDMGAAERQGPACPADFNGDGRVDGHDVAAYVHAYAAGDVRADVSGDGQVDRGDRILFQWAWRSGCTGWSPPGLAKRARMSEGEAAPAEARRGGRP